jgi:hypothetical protein
MADANQESRVRPSQEAFVFNSKQNFRSSNALFATADVLPSRKSQIVDGDYYESKSHGLMIRYQAPPDTIRWTVYCDEGKPSSGQCSLQALAQQYDELSKSRH